MKKAMKLVSILLMVLIMVSFVTPVFAGTATTTIQDPSKYTGNSSVQTTKLDSLGQSIVKIVTTVGSIASVIVLVVLGIKYMMGSAEEKAEYKKTLLPYVIGAVFVFAASTIASVIFNFATTATV